MAQGCVHARAHRLRRPAELLGYDEDLDRKLGIKLLHPRGAAHLRDRMVREAQALAQLSHPNVVQVYEVGEYGGVLYLAMEFLQGVTLCKWAVGRSVDEIVEGYVQAGRGLAAAHRARLFHRDFKPAKAMVGPRRPRARHGLRPGPRRGRRA